MRLLDRLFRLLAIALVSLSLSCVGFSPQDRTSPNSGGSVEGRDESRPVLTVNIGHSQNGYWDAVYSPNGEFLLTQGPNSVRLWEARTGRELRSRWAGEITRAGTIAFAPNGRTVLFGTNLSARLFEIETGNLLRTFEHSDDDASRWGSVRAAFSPDGRRVVTGSFQTGKVHVWHADTGRRLETFDSRVRVSTISVSPDSRYVLAGYADGTAKLWDIGVGELVHTFRGHSDYIGAASFSPDGRFVVTGSSDQTARLWRVDTGREVRMFTGHDDRVRAVTVSPDGRFIVIGSGNSVRISEIDSGLLVASFEERSNVLSVRYSPTGDTMVVGTNSTGAVLRSTDDYRRLMAFERSSGSVRGVSFSADGSRLHALSNDGVRAWDVQAGMTSFAYHRRGHAGTPEAVHPELGYFIQRTRDGSVLIRSLETGRVAETIQTGQHFRTAALSPDGSQLLTGSPSGDSNDNTAKLWDVSAGRVIHTFRSHPGPVGRVAFSPDGQYILTATTAETVEGTAIIWRASDQRQVRVFSNLLRLNTASFSPDGRRLITSSSVPYNVVVTDDPNVSIWEISTGRLVVEIQDDSVHGAGSAAFSTDGRDVFLPAFFGAVARFDVQTGKKVWQRQGHRGAVYTIAVAPNGHYIATGSADGTMRLWNSETGDENVATLSTPDGRDLTWTPEGYFAGDPDLGREAVYFVDGLTTIGIDQFFDQYYRPDIVEARIAGRDITELVGTRTAADSIVPLPEVSIELERGGGTFRGLTPETTAGITDVSSTDYLVADGRVRVRVTAEDTGGGAEDIRLFHNGTRVAGRSRGLARDDGAASGGADGAGASTSQTFSVALADGENELRAIAFSETRVESDPAVVVVDYEAPSAEQRPTLWVLAVGIDEYENELYNLDYAVADAQAFSRQIQGSAGNLFEYVEVRVLTDGDATRGRIESAFYEIALSARPQDVFAFFYAGHGIPVETDTQGGTEFYFLLHDVTEQRDEGQLASRGIAGGDFSQLAAAIPARNQLHVIDACYAGAITTAFLTQASATRVSLDRMSRATGSALIAAARAEQEALEFPALGQGALTYALVEGLAGAAAIGGDEITATMLRAYAGVTVPRLTAQHSGQAQDPTGFINGVDFPVGVR